MQRPDVVAAILVSLAAGSGIGAGLCSTRYFRADSGVQRLFAFWPVFWVVSIVVFVLGALLARYVTGGFEQTP